MPLIPLQQADPAAYNAWLRGGPAQPAASLNATNASAAAAGASAALSNQERTNAALQQPVRQAEVDQLNLIKTAGDTFSKTGGKNNPDGHGGDGYVSPLSYNNYRQQYIKAGGDPNNFDNKLAQYANPNNIWYDTQDNITTRSQLPILRQALTSYQNLDSNLVGSKARAQAEAKVKLFGPLAGILGITQSVQNEFKNNDAHDALINTQAGNIKSLVSSGGNSQYPLRNLTELGYMTDLLPKSTDTEAQAQAKTDQIDNLLRSKFGIDGVKDLALFGGK